MAEKIQPMNAASQVVDDFKLVEGIGPAVEKRLHAAGIQTYAQLARVKPEKLANILEGMIGYSPKRIMEQDWSGQARVLAEQAEQAIPEESHIPVNNSLHYASYTLELLLDRDNQVRRTRAMHVQTRKESSWAGWDADRLHGFLVESGQLQILLPQEMVSVKETRGFELASASSATLEASKPAMALQGVTKIVETRLFSQSGQPLGAMIPCNTPFEVQLMVDLSQVEAPKSERLSYDATIFIKAVGKKVMDVIGEKEDTISAVRSAVIDISSLPLAPGNYRLEALVALRPHSQPKSLKNQLIAMTEGMLLHVF
jgi:hypothetical protein